MKTLSPSSATFPERVVYAVLMSNPDDAVPDWGTVATRDTLEEAEAYRAERQARSGSVWRVARRRIYDELLPLGTE